ncbi:hypothetical protein IFM89_003312 [Coptis chinensis]|uniref:Protein kinase domain-containing protein n=1 Tax=Coptis chinensis TaxID=261450 RepID=A0A835IWG3_9MAGN|nr:hypothetical protein IFM89_003312 [Coptis chinensis]
MDSQSRKRTRSGEDGKGHYDFNLGENLTERYKILDKMGEGTFGQVLECWDRERQDYVAVKVVRSIPKYRDAAMMEINILEFLGKHEDSDMHCVQIRYWFEYNNHVCIVFEKLGPSLYDFQRKNSHCPYHIDLVKEFGRQLLESVAYVHDLKLVHTDLKPENILLVSSEYVRISSRYNGWWEPKESEIKLIDFGSSIFEDEHHTSIVSTRQYRAPEVILGLGWSYPCDIWSVGCILFELCTGKSLFNTHDNLEHLAMMERVLGPLPTHMAERASQGGAKKYFKRERLNWPEGAVSRESIKTVKELDYLEVLVDEHVRHHRTFINLLYKLLDIDQSERITARQALEHPFFH